MRFVSKSANFHAGNFRNAKEGIGLPQTRVIDGKTVTSQSEAYILEESIPIAFDQQGLLQGDIEMALSHWKHFPGLPVEEDEVTPANPVEYGRVGVWDSVAWQGKYELADEDREQAEGMLLNSPLYGIEFVVVEAAKAAKPWPSYDSTHHAKIASLASELGLTEQALAYERENKNRPAVIEALEAEVQSAEFVSA